MAVNSIIHFHLTLISKTSVGSKECVIDCCSADLANWPAFARFVTFSRNFLIRLRINIWKSNTEQSFSVNRRSRMPNHLTPMFAFIGENNKIYVLNATESQWLWLSSDEHAFVMRAQGLTGRASAVCGVPDTQSHRDTPALDVQRTHQNW